MGFRDTIEGARKEAMEAGGVFSGKQEEDKKKDESSEESKGFSKRSAARAKPSTTAAASVRVVSAEDARSGKSGKASSEMTKEERKAERNAMREAEDRVHEAGSVLLRHDEQYRRVQRVWWIMLGGGLVMTALSFGINYLVRKQDPSAPGVRELAIFALVSLAVAYAAIIGAFIYDLVRARPIRMRVEAEVKGMSKRRQEQIIREEAEAQAEKEAQKAAKKAEKKAGKKNVATSDGEGK